MIFLQVIVAKNKFSFLANEDDDDDEEENESGKEESN